MEKSSFFNSVSSDRRYSAEDWAAYFASFISNGVFAEPSDNLQVLINTGMGISIKPGISFVNGYRYQNTTDLIKTLAVADGIYNRIDRVVIRWSLLDRKITAAVLQGAPATTPVAPALTRDAEIYELALADIYVGAGVTSIVQSNITDRRPDSDLCGFVHAIIEQFDFSSLTTQFEAFFSEYQVRIKNEYNYWHDLGQAEYDALAAYMDEFEARSMASFMEWFDNLKYVLDGDVAGHLQNEIDAMEDVVNTAVAELEASMEATIEEVRLTGFSTYVHAKNGTEHTLTLMGGGNNIKFVATDLFQKNDTVKINGSAVTVLLPTGKAPGNKFFVAGSVVIGFLNGDVLYLVGGGGGGSGEQYCVTLSPASWYQQSPDAKEEYWYACDIVPPDFDPAEQDVVVSAADAATYDWITKHGYYELSVGDAKFAVQAKEKPTANLTFFYELKTRGEN